MRVRFTGAWIADSEDIMLLHEPGRYPVAYFPLSDIAELDQDCWFGERHLPTCRAVAEHARRIRDADLSYPVILSADGRLMDGGHRAAKAYLEGRTVISAVRFTVDPEPDRFIPDGVAW